MSLRKSASLRRCADADLREARAVVEEAKAQARADIAAHRRAAAEAEAARVTPTHVDVEGAIAVRDRWGWHRVTRVNQVSVTVAADAWFMEGERIPLSRVLEVLL